MIVCPPRTASEPITTDLTYGFGVFRRDHSMVFQMQVVPWNDHNTIKWTVPENGDYTIRSTEYSGPKGAQMNGERRAGAGSRSLSAE